MPREVSDFLDPGVGRTFPLQFLSNSAARSPAIPLLRRVANFRAWVCKINDLAAAKFRC
jgi:hypothetical protein